MSYTYEMDPKAMFEDRYVQFVSFGIPKADVDALRQRITDMWDDAPGGWTYEWSTLAKGYRDAGNPLLAATAYGFAKFPCLATQARVTAQTNQVASYLEAAPSFPVKFERRIVALPVGCESVQLPIHLFSASGTFDGPVLMFSGGVDTFKMDLHGVCLALAKNLGVTVIAFDIAGTGENPIALTADGGDAIIAGLAAEARGIGNGRVAYLGFSFGGNFSAAAGLTGIVDASIVVGGPVDQAMTHENGRNLPYGMAGIIGNDRHYDHEPSIEQFVTDMQQFSRRTLLDQPNNAPMLVINGADDYFVPLADTLVFAGRANTDVTVLGDSGHCALSRLPDVLALTAHWLPGKLAPTRR